MSVGLSERPKPARSGRRSESPRRAPAGSPCATETTTSARRARTPPARPRPRRGAPGAARRPPRTSEAKGKSGRPSSSLGGRLDRVGHGCGAQPTGPWSPAAQPGHGVGGHGDADGVGLPGPGDQVQGLQAVEDGLEGRRLGRRDVPALHREGPAGLRGGPRCRPDRRAPSVTVLWIRSGAARRPETRRTWAASSMRKRTPPAAGRDTAIAARRPPWRRCPWPGRSPAPAPPRWRAAARRVVLVGGGQRGGSANGLTRMQHRAAGVVGELERAQARQRGAVGAVEVHDRDGGEDAPVLGPRVVTEARSSR